MLDSSAHVAYRRRHGKLEITIKRGITDYEMDNLIGKLNIHRVGAHGAVLYVIKGSSRKSYGDMDDLNLKKFRRKIYDCLDKYSVIGIEIVDTVRKGILHKGHAHSMMSKEGYRSTLASETFGLK